MTTFLMVLFVGLIAGPAWMRGGMFHNLMVARAARAFERVGFTTRLECPLSLPNGQRDFVDILVQRGGVVIAVEVETTPRYVVVNSAKAAELNLALWIVVPNSAVQAAICKKLAALPLIRRVRTRVLLLLALEQELACENPIAFRGESIPEALKNNCQKGV